MADTLVLDAGVAESVAELVMVLLATARDKRGVQLPARLLVPAGPGYRGPDSNINPMPDFTPQRIAVDAAICGMVTALTGHPARIGEARYHGAFPPLYSGRP